MSGLRAGCGRVDITPPVGVELCGYGAYLGRRSTAVRDRLWARALALEAGGGAAVLVACDLIGTVEWMVERARRRFTAATGLPGEALLVCSSHTHSGPNTIELFGWGEPDAPYRELLPARIAAAAIAAWRDRAPARAAYGSAPLEGFAQNREYDRDALPVDEVLAPGWRPDRPELTDTAVAVLRVDRADGSPLAVVSHFGCHPVIGGAATTGINGDYPGVAATLLEAERPGLTALFVQGAQGDVNTVVVHKDAVQAERGLTVLARRYADAVAIAADAAAAIEVPSVRACERRERFARRPWTAEHLRGEIAHREAIVDAAEDAGERGIRHEVVYLQALRRILAAVERGDDLSPPIRMHGLRVGPLTILGSPFETFQAIKRDAQAGAASRTTWIAAFVDGFAGYAPDRVVAARGGYAADLVPLMMGFIPYASAHDDLVASLLRLDADLANPTTATAARGA